AAVRGFAPGALGGLRAVVSGDGRHTPAFAHVPVLVLGSSIAATAEAASGHVVNVGSGKSASLLELIALLRQAVGPEAAHLEPEHQAARAGDLRASSADLTKARRVLGYEPRIALAEGLADLVRTFRETL